MVSAFLLGLMPGLAEKYGILVKKHYFTQGSSCGLIRGYAHEFEENIGRKPDDEELLDWCMERFTADLKRMEYVPDAVEMQFRSP